MKKGIIIVSLLMIVCFVTFSAAFAQEKETKTAKHWWQKIFSYPANVTEESVNYVGDTAKGATKTVTNEVKTVGKVTSGEFDKTKNLITDPIEDIGNGTVERTKAVADIHQNAVAE